MKKLGLAVVLVLLSCFSVMAGSLPAEVKGTFVAVFAADGVKPLKPLCGDVTFTNNGDYPASGKAYNRVVSWGVEGSTRNGSFAFAGYLINDQAASSASAPDTGWWAWSRSTWETDLFVKERISKLPSAFSSDHQWVAGHDAVYFGPAWDLTSNENFLPVFGEINLYNGNETGKLKITFAFADPATGKAETACR